MKQFQGTVTRSIHFAGVGLHSNKLVNLEILPLEPGSGIYFQRTDLAAAEPIKALAPNISSTVLCTTLGHGNNSVATIEHLMAAFYGLGIDNALVLIDNKEVPILDGSSAPFVDKFVETGVQIQHEPRPIVAPDEPIEVHSDGGYVKYTPPKSSGEEECLKIHCSIDFSDSKAIGRQSFACEFSRETFMGICEARTFCHVDQVNAMRSRGLALGGSLDNAVVVDDMKVLNADGLRFENEFVRHKLLDFIGDLSLVPGHLCGSVEIYKGGHKLHALFTNKVYCHLGDHSRSNRRKANQTPYWDDKALA